MTKFGDPNTTLSVTVEFTKYFETDYDLSAENITYELDDCGDWLDVFKDGEHVGTYERTEASPDEVVGDEILESKWEMICWTVAGTPNIFILKNM